MVKETRYPVIIDATHAVQQPGGQGATSGGNASLPGHCPRGSLSRGCFIETHPEPDSAPSDGAEYDSS